MGQLTAVEEALLLGGGAGDGGLGVLGNELGHVGGLVELLLLLLKLKVKLLPCGLDLSVSGHDGPAEAARGDNGERGAFVVRNAGVTLDEVDSLRVVITELVLGVVGVQSDDTLGDLSDGPPDGDEVHNTDGGVGRNLLDDGIEVLDNETGDVVTAPEDT